MKNRIIDKLDSFPKFVVGNPKLLFNGLYIPKGSYLTVHSIDLLQFGFRGSNNPKVLLRNKDWKLYELELNVSKYERIVPELDFSSLKMSFIDSKEKFASRRALEGTVTGRTKDEVNLVKIDVFSLEEEGEDYYTDIDDDDQEVKVPIKYQINVDCAILITLSNSKCIHMEYCVNHEGYTVFFGNEELILKNAYLKTHWFDYPRRLENVKKWKRRTLIDTNS